MSALHPTSAAPARHDADRWTWKDTIKVGLAFSALWLMLLVLSKTGDTARAAAEVAASLRGEAVMVCMDGHIVYDGDSTLDRLTARMVSNGNFMCTDWRTREGLKPKR